MTNVLLKFRKDWADELDCYGTKIMPKPQWESLKTAIESVSREAVSYYFGTNEGWDDPIGSYLQDITVKEIDNNTTMVLIATIGAEFGNFPYLEDLLSDCTQTPEVIAYLEGYL